MPPHTSTVRHESVGVAACSNGFQSCSDPHLPFCPYFSLENVIFFLFVQGLIANSWPWVSVGTLGLDL